MPGKRIALQINNVNRHIKAGRLDSAITAACAMPQKAFSRCKVNGVWILHNLPLGAFERIGDTRKYTILLIQHFINAGWNINSAGKIPTPMPVPYSWGTDNSDEILEWVGYTILHRVVNYDCLDIVKILIRAGADVNAKTRGGGTVIVTPLHSAILMEQFKIAAYLVNNGSNISSVGLLPDNYLRLRCVDKAYSKIINGQRFQKFTPLELLLVLARDEGLTLLNIMLQKLERPLMEREFQVAVFGGNYQMLYKLLGVARPIIGMYDLQWLKSWSLVEGEEDLKVPALTYLVCRRPWLMYEDLPLRLCIMRQFFEVGYDCNLGTKDNDPLIFKLLQLSTNWTDAAVILKTLLLDDFAIDIERKNCQGETVLQYLFRVWDVGCSCKRQNKDILPNMVSALLVAGADVTQLSIGKDFCFHDGYKRILQHLFIAGANITDDFAKAKVVCRWSNVDVTSEREDLNTWLLNAKERKYNNLMTPEVTLKNLAGGVMRSMVRREHTILHEIPLFIRRFIACTELNIN